jgi:tetratricopeptide (TPR) repeat protein
VDTGAVGFFGRLFGKRNRAIIEEGGMIVFRRRELAELMKRPKEPNGSAEAPPCEQCGRAIREALITTGGPLGDPELWRDHPIAVDGWACTDCGVFRYPRRIEPEAISQLAEDGIRNGQAGRFADAEWCFARIVWNWPGYLAGHLNFAEALRSRLHRSQLDDDQVRRRVVLRMIEQYEEAIEAFQKAPRPEPVAAIARACLTVAEHAIEDRALDRARRYADMCLGLPGVATDSADVAREIHEYIRTRRDMFDDANRVLGPRIGLSGRAARPPATPDERKQVALAIENLEHHVALAPERWQSAWLYAKALHLVDRDPDAFEVWRRAFEKFPAERDLARAYSNALLQADRVDEARTVARAIAERLPDDATLWCNLSVTEILSNDLDAAEAALARSRTLDPSDKIADLVASRIAGYRSGKPVPRTMRELERPS